MSGYLGIGPNNGQDVSSQLVLWGRATAGMTSFVVPDGVIGVRDVIINGSNQQKGQGFTYNKLNRTVTLAGPCQGTELIVIDVIMMPQTVVQPFLYSYIRSEISKANNILESKVLLSSEVGTSLDSILVIYDVVSGRIYGKPGTVPSGSTLVSLSGTTLTYKASGVDTTVALIAPYNSYNVLSSGANPGGTVNNDAAFTDATAMSDSIYVPDGVYRLSTPMILDPKVKIHGEGRLIFDNAEWWRRGGSSGSVSVNERYTLFYNYTNQSDVTLTVDGVSVPFTWVDARTIEAAGTTTTQKVVINIANGYIDLGPAAECIRSYNVFMTAGSGAKITPILTDPLVSPVGYNNTALGARTLMDMINGVNNTAIGSFALMTNQAGNNNTAMGYLALYRSLGSNNTAIGSVSSEWLTTGQYNTTVGASSAEKLKDGSYNVAIGYQALGESPSSNYSVAIGYRANANTGDHSHSNTVTIGAFAGDFSIGSNNTHIGYRAGNNINGATDAGTGTGHDNTFIGMFAARTNQAGSESVVVGAGSATAATRVNGAVVIGYAACGVSTSLGDYTVAIGHSCLASSTATNNTGIGQQALLATTSGGYNTAIGASALVTNTTGTYNTAIGYLSGRLTQAGANTAGLTNTTTIGYDARVSGDNQVQIGNANTTTYVYGTVQNRSDTRDKILNTDAPILGLDFILALEPVQGVWNLRDDYYTVNHKVVQEAYETEKEIDGVLTTVTEYRDVEVIDGVTFDKEGHDAGTKRRTRLHQWFTAQGVLEVLKSLGVNPDDVGLIQHQAVNGGDDTYTLGYDEFIPPIVSAVKSCWKRMDEMEDKYNALLAKMEELEAK